MNGVLGHRTDVGTGNRHTLAEPGNGSIRPGAPRVQPSKTLLRAAVRLNIILLGLTMGIGGGLGLFLFTHLSMAVTGDRAGHYLNLLGVFMPGYSATPAGAWFGLIWGFVLGAFTGALIYWLYARLLGNRIIELSSKIDADEGAIVAWPTLRLSGTLIGLALGGVMSVQIFLTTMWLVVRGTADQSVHAALLSNYLPGYRVDLVGGLIGAAEIFVITFAFAALLGAIYNLVADLRDRGASK